MQQSVVPEINSFKLQETNGHLSLKNESNEVVMTTENDMRHLDFAGNHKLQVHVYGSGGCGKAAAIRYSKTNSGNPVTVIDTSGFNDIPGVESICISGLNGSGKFRRENVDEITKFIVDYTHTTTFGEVNIVMMSLSGGSGSVIGPLLISEIVRQKKIVIVVAIIDTDSEVDTINAFNTLLTINNVGSESYIPIIMFDNNNGRFIVDKGIDTVMRYLNDMLNVGYIGLDSQDIIKFLNPSVFEGVDHGLHLLNLSRRDDGEWEKDLGLICPDENTGEKLDATLVIEKVNGHRILGNRCTVTFRGFYVENHEDLVASIGYHIPENFIRDMNSNLHSFKKSVSGNKTEIKSEYEIGKQTKDGLFL